MLSRYRLLDILFGFLLGGIIVGIIVFTQSTELSSNTVSEINAIDESSGDINLAPHNKYFATSPKFTDLIVYFEDLAHSEGAVYAFEVLKYADLPPNSDTHLLGHFVGDILYEQSGIEAMRNCDSSLGYACAHSVVINALLEQGLGVFDFINEVCASIGQPGSYEMCFHGFGHGVLAFAEYNMEDAVELCGRVGTKEHNFYEEEECIGGVIMEMRDGIHDPIVWKRMLDQYLSPDNPLALCQSDYMLDKYKSICYIYITPFIFDHVTPSDLPPPSSYRESMLWCEKISDEVHKEACYGGFGKEYIGFTYGRDVRLLANASSDRYQAVHDWCAMTDSPSGEAACVKYALYGNFRAGSNPFEASIVFCDLARTDNLQETCFQALIDSASNFHSHDSNYRQSFCPALPDNYQNHCEQEFSGVNRD